MLDGELDSARRDLLSRLRAEGVRTGATVFAELQSAVFNVALQFEGEGRIRG
jgi:hypothetical protein